jgi:hypothetical protein
MQKEKNAAIEPQVTDTEKNPVITSKKNGTTFTIVLKSSENASRHFEDLMKEVIEKEAILLDLCGFEGC